MQRIAAFLSLHSCRPVSKSGVCTTHPAGATPNEVTPNEVTPDGVTPVVGSYKRTDLVAMGLFW